MRDFAKKLLEIISTDYSGLNLTRILDFEEFYMKQIEDSIIPYRNSSIFREAIESRAIIIDVGFGGGFPLLPLAETVDPAVRLLGIEARAKKTIAVQEIAYKLELKNVTTKHMRIEELLLDLPVVLTFKAVGDIDDCLSKLNFSVNPKVFFYKGRNVNEKESSFFIKNLDWQEIERHAYNIGEMGERFLLGFEPANENISDVPRGTKEIKFKTRKDLVKLSKIL